MVTVYLNEEAYHRLKFARREGESFSDVIMRTVNQEINIKEFLGCCKGIDAKKLITEIKRERNR